MHIEPLDTGDRASVDAAVEVLAAAQAVDFPDDPKFCPRSERARIMHPLPDSRYEWWVVRSADRVDGLLSLHLPQLDNVTTALAELTVHPQARRRGLGTTLDGFARTRTAAHGRKLLIAWSVLGGGAERFLQHGGYTVGLTEHRQRLVVEDTTSGRWTQLEQDALPHAGGYSLVQWRNETPEEHAAGLAYLSARMSTDAPMGELEWEAESWDADRVRNKDRAMTLWGRRLYTTAAVHEATGRMAAYTTLAYSEEDPTTAWQWNTIVDPEHRGHRLGVLVKVANHRFAFGHEPATRIVLTWNAESNTHMNAINTALGFGPIDRWAESQLHLS